MIEIRFHGRGGQGAVVAAKILADAFFREGKHVQSFPAFGVERRGAPVMAFTRAGDSPIFVRCNIYNPDVVVVMDPTLMREINVTEGLRTDGMVIINMAQKDIDASAFEGFRVASVDATAIAVGHGLGTNTNPIVNTAILGAFARASESVGIESVSESILVGVPKDAVDNAAAARDAYDKTHVLDEAMKQP